MDLNIQDKVMIVTGGASGIGEAICRVLAEEGAIPVIADMDESTGLRLLEELEKSGSRAYLAARKLESEESCKKTVQEVADHFGRVDGLFNNAGINDSVSLEKGTADQFRDSLSNNIHHYFFMTQACLPELKKSKGVILNISSKTAVTGQGGTSGYAASKGAQLALTREWAVELLKYGIRVNASIPAEVITPQYESWLAKNFKDPEKTRKTIEGRVPLGKRFTTPHEIADMAVFLASGRASHITGQHIYVDGGYVHLDRALDG
jgi:L-fucose dehydrogenase